VITRILAFALLLCATGSHAQPVDDLQRDDALVLSVAWRLQVGNAQYCPHVTRQTGIQLQDTATYGDPALARQTFGLSGDIYIGALAADSPGSRTGLTVNTTVIAIDGHPLSAIPTPARSAPFARWHAVQDMLDLAAAHDGAVDLTTADNRVIHVAAVPACQITVKVDDQKSYANATRDEIRVGRRYVDAAHGDPALIAALIAHEMAHAVLDHQSQIEASHKALATVRRTEHEADRLSVWLLANAGYPPEAAIALQRGVVAKLTGPFAIDTAHGNWRERASRIEREIATMKAAPDADWPRRFQREPAD
jgi:hypothetical protein